MDFDKLIFEILNSFETIDFKLFFPNEINEMWDYEFIIEYLQLDGPKYKVK